MKIKLIIIGLFFSITARASDINIFNLQVRKAYTDGATTTIYFDINNNSDEINYLLDAEIINCPTCKVTINKTVIEKNVARIITINRLAIPANSSINLAQKRIYMVIKNLGLARKPHRIKLIFQDQEVILDLFLVSTLSK
ncbi:MAG: hypothetical protein AABY27_01785 [Pseudomonadota bacterium]